MSPLLWSRGGASPNCLLQCGSVLSESCFLLLHSLYLPLSASFVKIPLRCLTYCVPSAVSFLLRQTTYAIQCLTYSTVAHQLCRSHHISPSVLPRVSLPTGGSPRLFVPCIASFTAPLLCTSPSSPSLFSCTSPLQLPRCASPFSFLTLLPHCTPPIRSASLSVTPAPFLPHFATSLRHTYCFLDSRKLARLTYSNSSVHIHKLSPSYIYLIYNDGAVILAML